MKTEIEWHEYDNGNPSTYPPSSEGQYLLTVEFYSRVSGGETRIVMTGYWIDDYKFSAHEGYGSRVTHWAKIEPCME